VGRCFAPQPGFARPPPLSFLDLLDGRLRGA
jgi:hypothetical protein